MTIVAIILIIFLILLLLVLLGVGIASYVFQGIGISNMYKKLGLENGWIAFIPIANVYAFGNVARHYIKKDGSKSTNFGLWLLLTDLIYLAITLVFSFAAGLILGIMVENGSMTYEVSEIVSSLISLFCYVFYIPYIILFYVALWRIFAIFDKEKSTLYTVLCLLVPFAQPVCIFLASKKEPVFNTPAVDFEEIDQQYDYNQ